MKTLVTAAVVVFFAGSAIAGVPDVVTYAGTLRQGASPANGTFSAVFTLFDAPTAGNVLFTQTEASLAVTDGELVVDLGSQPSDPLDDSVLAGGSVFLSIAVNGDELSPRVALTSAPFARRAALAEDADTLAGLTPDAITAQLTASGGLQRDGNVFSIASNGVATANIADGAVTSAKLAAASVGATQLANGAVGTNQLSAHAVTTGILATGAVDATIIATGAVTSAGVLDHSLTNADLAAGTITGTELAAGSVDATKIAAGTITANQIATASKVGVFAVTQAAVTNCASPGGSVGQLTTVSGCTVCGTTPSGCASSGVFCNPVSLGLANNCSNTFLGNLVK